MRNTGIPKPRKKITKSDPTGKRGILSVQYLRRVYQKYVGEIEHDIANWLESLMPEHDWVFQIFRRRDKETEIRNFDYYIRRLILFKRDYPHFTGSGDFDLLKQIILTGMRIDELHEVDILSGEFDPKMVDAYTRQMTQLEKHLKSLGGTSKAKREEQMEVMKVVMADRGSLNKVKDRLEATDTWLDQYALEADEDVGDIDELEE